MIPRLSLGLRLSRSRSNGSALAQVVLILAACIDMGLFHHVQCANFTVGAGFTDTVNPATGMNYTWTNTVDGLVRSDVLETAYQQWANSVNITAGDTLIFDYIRGQHTVFLAKSELEYANCDFSGGSLEIIPDTVPATYTIKPTDLMLFFTCTLPGHCLGGQKVKVAPFGTSSAPAITPPVSNAAPYSNLSIGTIVLLLFLSCYFSRITQIPSCHLFL